MERSEAIRNQVSRILASPTFSKANRSSQLLRYLVDATLSGQHQEIKEYTIATQVFGKPETFDPRIDSLVRVEVTRLRNRLQAYYESATEDDLIEITLAAGTYVPAFESREAAPITPTAEPPTKRSFRIWWLGPALAVLLIAGYAVARGIVRSPNGAPAGFKKLRRLSIPDEVLLFPALSPRADEVYFASNRGGGGFRIWKQTWDGKTQQVLTPPDSDAYDLDVSPDGAWIAYWSSRHGGAIYQQSTSGGEELLVSSEAQSPRFSPDGKFILYWVKGSGGGFGKVFISGITPDTHDREPHAIAGDFDDAHNPQWMSDGQILLCGTRRSNIAEMEHDLWVVSRALNGPPPVKTGLLRFLNDRQIRLHPRTLASTSFRFLNGNLIFSGLHNGRAATYRLRMTADWHPAGEPERLDYNTSSADTPNVRDKLLAFATLESNLNLWAVPLDVNGRESGSPRRLTQAPDEEFFPCLSADGRRLHYLATRPPNFEIWRKEIATGVESLTFQSADARMLRCTPDGRKLFFRSLIGGFPQKQSILMGDSDTGVFHTVCEDCGTPTSVSAGGEFVAFETGSRAARIGVFDTRTRVKQRIVSDPHHATQAARISPDGKWLAFELDKGPDGKHIVIAPFRGLNEIPQTDWIRVTTTRSSFEPAWGPDGDRLYFISDRLGSRDLWMQRLVPQTKQPQGEAELVHRFRNANLTPLSYSDLATRYIGLNVSRTAALLPLSELSSSIELVSALP